MTRPSVLYISYDGMLEALGQSQVIAYLEGLSSDYQFHLVSFEKPRDLEDAREVARLRAMLGERGIAWHPLRYHKWPPVLSTVLDMAIAGFECRKIALREGVRLLHARNILCAAMAYPAVRSTGGKFIVDIRGFWADERADGGIIRPGGLVHRVLRSIERKMLRSADHIVTLTQASVPYLRSDARFGKSSAPVSVIPTCVDLALFTPAERKAEPFTLGYVGQIGGWYLLEEMADLFRVLREEVPGARLLIVNQHQQREIVATLRASGFGEDDYELVGARRHEVPALIGRMSAGLALYQGAFSDIARAPTKLAEYLACGVPCVGNTGVGDVAEIIEANDVGVVLRGFSRTELKDAVRTLLELSRQPDLARRCRTVAEGRFALSSGVEKYRKIYRQLLGEQR